MPDSRVAAAASETTCCRDQTAEAKVELAAASCGWQLTCSRRTPNVGSRFRWPGGGLGPPNHATIGDRRDSVTRLKEAFLFYGSNAGITREIVPRFS